MGQRVFPKEHRLSRLSRSSPSLQLGEETLKESEEMKPNVALDCGWGKIIFGQTFADHQSIIDLFMREPDGSRHLAMYVRDHHVLLSRAPDLLFLDPSNTYRLWAYNYRTPAPRRRGFRIRLLQAPADAERVVEIYERCGLVPAPADIILANQHTRIFSYFLAEDAESGVVIGTITGIDHRLAFNDPEDGSSFWSLAVDPSSRARGVGRGLVRCVIEHFLARGRQYVDLSVLHNNKKAVRLYRSLNFKRVPVYVVKRKNEINREFYTGGPRP